MKNALNFILLGVALVGTSVSLQAQSSTGYTCSYKGEWKAKGKLNKDTFKATSSSESSAKSSALTKCQRAHPKGKKVQCTFKTCKVEKSSSNNNNKFLPGVNIPSVQVGTKFACCKSTSGSSLGGGGCTTWERTLKDRALTQIDAGARCAAKNLSLLYWGTHSCPKSSLNCSSSVKTCRAKISISNFSSRQATFLFTDHLGAEKEYLAPTITKSYNVVGPAVDGSCDKFKIAVKWYNWDFSGDYGSDHVLPVTIFPNQNPSWKIFGFSQDGRKLSSSQNPAHILLSPK